MPKFELLPFNPIDGLSIKGELIFFEGKIQITYNLQDLNTLIEFNDTSENERVVGLWESTCFELFILSPSGKYYEFNFSPSGNWNIFYFESYRSDLKEAIDCPTPLIDVRAHKEKKIHLTYDLFELPNGFFEMGKMKVGITAVLEDNKKSKSFWSLAHPKDKADFHSPIGMTIKL